MKRPFLAGLLALGCLGLVAACKDVARPDATGSIVLNVTSPGDPVAGGPARSPAQPAGRLTSAKATATGPTTKTIDLVGGASTTSFTGTITGLNPGSYTVTIQGFVGTEVDYYGQTTGVSVTAGATATATITNWTSFVPTLGSFASATTWSFRPLLNLTAATNATGYVIEVDRSNSFPNPAITTLTSATGASVAVVDTGTHYVRVRAVNATVAAGGSPSATQAVRIVTDQRPSGNDFATALSLGFFGAVTTRTLDSLNIFPATDTDWFGLSDCNGDSVTVTAQAVRLNPASPLNTVLAVFSGATGRLITANDNGDSTDARLRMLLSSDGTYKLVVAGNGSTVGHYKLVVQIKPGANNTGVGCKLQPLTVSTVSLGLYHSCSLRSGGIIDCWGRNIYGELGNGTSANAISSPVRVSGTQTWQAVSAGGLHTCGLTSTGAAYCWGRNGNGQLGNGGNADATSPVAVSAGILTFQKIASGVFHTCAVAASGAGYCWGSNLNGKLGNGNTTSSSTPVGVSGGLFFQAIGAGDQHSCGLTTGGAVYCWGDNDFGQLGNGTNTDNLLPTFVGSGYTALAVGGYHTCALTTTGSVQCWGYGYFGQLGDNAFASSNLPVTVAGALTFSAISAGRYTTCGIAAGVSYCWGDNFDGEVGDGTTIHRGGPTAVSGVSFQSLGVGGYHTCGVQVTTGNSYCWGWNTFGQLGDAGAFEHTGPVAVAGITNVTLVSTGNEHTCARTSLGAAYCWGWNENGQLGDGGFTDRASPGLVSGLSADIEGVGAGQQHACAVNTGIAVYCWGDNSDGQLGNGTTASSNLPVAVTGGIPFSAISVGDWHTCGVGLNQLVYCWGDNVDGQLGNGSTTDALSPVQISSALTFKQVSAGGALTCALTTGNVPYCWGDNSSGGVGNGATSGTPVTTPTAVQVPAGVTFASISAGYDFACAVASNGVGYCWGSNQDGQLGNNSTTSSSTPVQVGGGVTWKAISASRTSGACGITSTDVLRCWGNNFTGQLGDGTFNNTNSPALVLAAGTWQWIQAGDVHSCGVSSSLAYCWGNDERGELGRGSITGIRTTPGQVRLGPVSAPVLASDGLSVQRSLDAVLTRPEGRGAASLERVKTRIRRPRR